MISGTIIVWWCQGYVGSNLHYWQFEFSGYVGSLRAVCAVCGVKPPLMTVWIQNPRGRPPQVQSIVEVWPHYSSSHLLRFLPSVEMTNNGSCAKLSKAKGVDGVRFWYVTLFSLQDIPRLYGRLAHRVIFLTVYSTGYFPDSDIVRILRLCMRARILRFL